MAFDKILQCLNPLRRSRSASRETSSPVISAPFDARWLYHETDDSRPLGDDTDGNTTKLRHTTGPGFQFMSDLHYEQFFDKATQHYKVSEIPKCAPYIILAGDIGRFVDRNALQRALQQICDKFEKVLYVPGNHEFYGTSRQDGLRIADAMSQHLGDKLVFLNRTRVDLEDMVILGCTLQSHIPEGAHLTNDFAEIKGWTVADHNAEHQRDLQWLEQALGKVSDTKPESRVVIVTHYAPTFNEANLPRFQQSPYRYCFSSNTLLQFKYWKGADQVSHWIFGHTHYNTVFTCGDTVVASNQPNDNDCNLKFDPEATI